MCSWCKGVLWQNKSSRELLRPEQNSWSEQSLWRRYIPASLCSALFLGGSRGPVCFALISAVAVSASRSWSGREGWLMLLFWDAPSRQHLVPELWDGATVGPKPCCQCPVRAVLTGLDLRPVTSALGLVPTWCGAEGLVQDDTCVIHSAPRSHQSQRKSEDAQPRV